MSLRDAIQIGIGSILGLLFFILFLGNNELPQGFDFTLAKDFVDIVNKIVGIIAIFVGGLWGYMLFLQRRQRFPNANLDHIITHRRISKDKVLIHIVVVISSIGDVLLSLINWKTKIHQVLPFTPEIEEKINAGKTPLIKGYGEISWPVIEKRESAWPEGTFEIEPSGIHEIHYDFIIDGNIKTIAVYTYIRNVAKPSRDIGWGKTSLYDITDPS